ncbi:ATP-binding protein [Desulfosediminicola flagellatus]|uniref:ATP-binding protein n=1 Tax=Desulfosediminicola flagellatus TaxID=2569541 RepID=UPI0010AB5D5E|nr:DUF87 domain-containing protein [Desulfosediminicola flagellatus]
MGIGKAYEKLGLFYLGRELDLTDMTPTPTPLLYRNRNLTTHGAIIGMTGSGKTGLGIGLIEEAIMDNIPSIIIDPKGDMGNLLLNFSDLKPEDFKPWIDPAEAAAKGESVDEYATRIAETWKKGLASWDQDTSRIAELSSKTTMTIYTPGSSAGVAVSVLSGFDAPDAEVVEDTDTFNSLVNSTATSLLALINIKGDPLQSREHILISSLLLYCWRNGQNLTLEQLIGQIVSPPFDTIGVFPLDTFFAQPDRMKLAMLLNNILASPGFSAWTQGNPLDIQHILYSPEGKPQTAIFSLAHLSESERMFFVTTLLTRFITWMRSQPGSSSLKALLYMDEIFGYFPPTANPPSKKPMLLLLKQARAYGCGVVLATQNPVDLDYKGLSNIGSWFIGRLQTEQDQQRVASGIAGASGGRLEEGQVKALLNNLKSRQFLLNSANLDEPVLFESRWVMSYLKGPISSKDISVLMAHRKKGENATDIKHPHTQSTRKPPQFTDSAVSQKPVLSAEIEQLYFMQNITEDRMTFEPYLAAVSKVRFFKATCGVDEVKTVAGKIPIDEHFNHPKWDEAEMLSYELADCTSSPPSESWYMPLPSSISSLKNLRTLTKSFSDYLYQSQRLELFRCRLLKLESRPDEELGNFKVRISDELRGRKEEAVEKLRSKYAVKQQRLEQRLMKALQKVEKEEYDVKSRTTDTLLSIGVAVVGAFFGRKSFSTTSVSRAATGMRKASRVVKEKGDVKRAEEDVELVQQDLEDLAVQIEEEIETITESFEPEQYEIETFAIKPRRSDIFDVQVCLVWETM